MNPLYCWRCKAEVPMLDDQEWGRLYETLKTCILDVKRYRLEHNVGLGEAPVRAVFQPALDEYERLTGARETNPNALWHHRLSLYGPPCRLCGKPLRTPRAKLCAACMAPR